MQANAFYDLLIQEIDQNIMGLDDTSYQMLRSYYRSLATRQAERKFFRYNWMQRTAPLAQALQSLPKQEQTLHVLDAGCGVGSETLFMSLQRDDLQVTGVDIAPDRLKAAFARKTAYENYLKHPVQAKFVDQDVFDVLKQEQFHLVWVMEAISHIDPAEDFLALVHRQLAPGGMLVVSDSHLFNPAVAWEEYTRRRQGVPLRTTRTISSGKQVSYAHERLFTVSGMQERLAKAGFVRTDMHMSIFFPPQAARYAWLFSLSCAVESLLKRIPGLRRLGGIYTLVAHKHAA